MNKFFSSILLLSLALALTAQEQIIPPTAEPGRIMLTIPGDPSSTAAVTWRTIFTDTVTLGQIAKAEASPAGEEGTATIRGKAEPWEKGSTASMGHRIVFKNLTPSTKYIYRVGNGKNWSEWFSFTTASAENDPFSFIYLGDMQNDIASQCSRVIRQAYSHFPDSRFILFAGDIVDRSYDERWNQFFHSGGWIFGTMPVMPTPGNHEYYPDPANSSKRTFSNHWQQIFTMPSNGPSPALESRIYYTDYQGVRFISLDSPALSYNSEEKAKVLEWLENILASNSNKWTILFTHYPIYSCSQGRDSESYRNAVRPILEKYGVDLVLQGHDHTYCRGQNLQSAGQNARNHPVYVVSVAGPKMYGLNPSLWADRVASETQLYQHISVSENEIGYRSFTAAGDIYDGFTITRKRNGSNTVKEMKGISDIKERITIPESRRSSYKPEEISKIEARGRK